MRTAIQIMNDATLTADAKLAEMAAVVNEANSKRVTADMSYADFTGPDSNFPESLILTGELNDGTEVEITLTQRGFGSGGFGYAHESGKVNIGGTRFQVGSWSVIGSKNRADAGVVAGLVAANKAEKAAARK